MNFSIPCATFVRLSAICEWVPDNWPQDYLRALYVERKNEKLIAIATNVKLAAIELVSNDCLGPDEHCFIAFDPELIEQARKEMQFSSTLSFVVMRELSMSMAKTSFGYSHPANVGVFPTDEKIETISWRRWLPDELPKASHGQMIMDCNLLNSLARSAPSGDIVFPPFIDTRAPSIVRDKIDPSWIGLFYPMHDVNYKPPKLRIPTW